MSEEIKELYALAISCIVTALVLSIVSLGLHTKSSFAATRNNQLSQQSLYNQYTEFGVYNEKTVNGAEVVSIIRDMFSHDGVTLYVDKDKNNQPITVSKEISRKDPVKASYETLTASIHSEQPYKVWIVYDSMEPTEFIALSDLEKAKASIQGHNVTGVVFLKQ